MRKPSGGSRPVATAPPAPPAPPEDHALTWTRPPTVADRELLGRMLVRAESEGRPLAAESIRARLDQLGAS